MKKLLSILLAALLLVSTFGIVSAKTVDNTREGVGMSVAGFSARYILGDEYLDGSVLEDYDLTFINYWATWCGPCVGEMPHIRQMYNYFNETEENDVNVIGVVSISGSCTEQSAAQFLDQNGYSWPNVVPDSILRAVFNTSGYIPQTLIVDRNGVVRDHIVGSFSSYDQLLEYVNMWLDTLQNHENETCTVSYVSDATGEVLLEQEVPYGSVIVPPTDVPEVEGYTFVNWTYNDPNILETGYETVYHIAMGDCTVTAHYNVRRYLVRFYDSFNNHIISSQQVEYGSAAVEPNIPNHEEEGVFFLGWDRDFSCITEQTFIYSVIRRVGDLDNDGSVSVMDALSILRIAMGINEIDDITFADVNLNGTVEVSDAIIALRTAMGIVS